MHGIHFLKIECFLMNYLIIVCQFSSAFRLHYTVFDIDSRFALTRVANSVSPGQFSILSFPTHNSPVSVPSSHYQTNVTQQT